MKKYIRASENLVDTFLRYHDDEKNYHSNPSGFDAMYEILEKYDDSNHNDTVDVAFKRATPEDQKRMVELITPKAGRSKDEVRREFSDLLAKCYSRRNVYDEGFMDAVDLIEELGYIDTKEF